MVWDPSRARKNYQLYLILQFLSPRLGAISQLIKSLGMEPVLFMGEPAFFKSVYERGIREDLLKFSLIIVASVPVLRIYPFVQKYFARGVMIGSIKG